MNESWEKPKKFFLFSCLRLHPGMYPSPPLSPFPFPLSPFPFPLSPFPFPLLLLLDVRKILKPAHAVEVKD